MKRNLFKNTLSLLTIWLVVFSCSKPAEEAKEEIIQLEANTENKEAVSKLIQPLLFVFQTFFIFY
ncbi:hypothetical protein [Ichthyobacterium seriolicida]|uniref:Lipoprotein n=1 Tax=Ichthyobacterium seriolicida TaxID=242600 RepID=A0A1J1DZ96_9FLAO|nr:hypothetical protein [Ichthyobacterium seriolicida]BAV95217.1 hypothetical protein JBKA6_1204 [Ichthyobacterium seriolicida]